MSVLGTLENGLFALSQVLRLPVIALLWVCVAMAVFMSAGCVVEFLARRRERSGFDLKAWVEDGALLKAEESRRGRLPTALQALLSDVTQTDKASLDNGGLEHLVLGAGGTRAPYAERLASLGTSRTESRAPGYADSDGNCAGVADGRQPRGDGRADGGGVYDHHRWSVGRDRGVRHSDGAPRVGPRNDS